MIITIADKGVDFAVKENDYYGDREKSVDSLRAKIGRLKKRKASKNRIASVEVELYKKFALSFACLVMVMVGGVCTGDEKQTRRTDRHIHTHTSIGTCIHTYTSTYVRMCMCISVHMCTCVCRNTRTLALTNIHKHTRVHTH